MSELYTNVHHKPRKEKIVPPKYDTEQRRCSKFYCCKVKGNACCNLCPLDRCENKCLNNCGKCNCLTDLIGSKSTMMEVGG